MAEGVGVHIPQDGQDDGQHGEIPSAVVNHPLEVGAAQLSEWAVVQRFQRGIGRGVGLDGFGGKVAGIAVHILPVDLGEGDFGVQGHGVPVVRGEGFDGFVIGCERAEGALDLAGAA